MNIPPVVLSPLAQPPALVAPSGDNACTRFCESFAANIRNNKHPPPVRASDAKICRLGVRPLSLLLFAEPRESERNRVTSDQSATLLPGLRQLGKRRTSAVFAQVRDHGRTAMRADARKKEPTAAT
jgi:hypothetical protein